MPIAYDLTFHPSWWHKHAGIDFDRPFFDDEAYRIEADVRMRRFLYDGFGAFGLGEKNPRPRPILGTDLLACGYLYSEMLGCAIRYAADASPEVICANLDDEAALALTAPPLDASPVWRRMQAQIDRMTARYDHYEPQLNLMGVQNIALDLRGSRLFMDYYENEAVAERLLSQACALSLDVGRRLRESGRPISGGVTAIVNQTCPDVYLTSNCSVEMVSQRVYEDFLLPYDIQLARAFAPFGVHHCGATMEHVVKGYARLPNLAFAEIGAGSDIAAVRAALPGAFLNLRYSPVELRTATEDALRAKLQAMVEAAGGRDCSVSCVGIDSEVSVKTVRAFLRAAKALNA
ncbi:MAG TPA: hypothetical protein PKE04_04880 [Clostridia bacterium]|nr:hypothetical protein [Clostridia bacterium]